LLLDQYAEGNAQTGRGKDGKAAKGEVSEAKFSATERKRFPVLGAFDLCLKCSHLFNILDARGAISVTERVGVIARIRALAVGVAKAYVDQQIADSKCESRSDTNVEQVPTGK
jgi:glycyl-tRNA synthetase alpha subunit